MIQAHPLHWPVGYNRKALRTSSRFNTKPEAAQKLLRNEIKLLGGTDLIVSSNVAVRNDGWIYFDMASAKLPDPGVAIYFKWKKKDVCLCADTYVTPIENLYALAKTIEAIRGIDRWGVSDFLDHAFTGFKALPFEATPPLTVGTWYEVLCVDGHCSEDEAKKAFRDLSKKYHPDTAEDKSNPDFNKFQFENVQAAYTKFKSIRGIK